MTEAATKEQKAVAHRPNLETGGRPAPIIPRNIDEVARVANAVLAADLAPDSYRKADGRNLNKDEVRSRVMLGIMKGAEVGLAPLSALSNIAIINGRPSIWGDGAMALVQKSGNVKKIKEYFEGEPPGEDLNSFSDDYTAVCEIWRVGQDEPYVGRFSVRDAKRAKLWGHPKKIPWIQHPRRMLQWRARTYPLRDGFSDCLFGLSLIEEVRDMPSEQHAPQAVDMGALKDDDAPAPEPVAEPEVEDAEIEPETPPEPEEAPEAPSEAPAGAEESPGDMFPGDGESESGAQEIADELVEKINRVGTLGALATLFSTVLDPEMEKLPDDEAARVKNAYDRKLAALKKAGK